MDSPRGQNLIKTIVKNNINEHEADILLYYLNRIGQKSYTVSKPNLADLQDGFFSGASGLSISSGNSMS